MKLEVIEETSSGLTRFAGLPRAADEDVGGGGGGPLPRGEGVAAALDTMLAGAMTWLPGDQAGERRGRRRVMDHSAWMPIDKPVR